MFVSVAEDFGDKVEHLLEWGSLTAEILCFEDFWCVNHVVDHWDGSLGKKSFDHTLIVQIQIHDLIINSPHPLTDLRLVVKELSDASKCFISIILA